MIKIRLEGLVNDIEKAKKTLKEVFNVLNCSPNYVNHNDSQYYRAYLECETKNVQK